MPRPLIVTSLTVGIPCLAGVRELIGPAGGLGCAVGQVQDVDLREYTLDVTLQPVPCSGAAIGS